MVKKELFMRNNVAQEMLAIQIAKKHEKELTEKSFLLMLAIPLNVLIDQWGDEAKEKAPKFIDDCMSLMHSYEKNAVSYEELAELIYEYSGVKIEAPWINDKVGG